MTQKVRYYYRDAVTVPAEQRSAASEMLAFSIRDLKLGGINLRWVKEVSSDASNISFTSDKNLAGRVRVVDLKTIWVNVDLTPEATRRTVAHEARHIHQMVNHGQGHEEDAKRYEEYAIRAYILNIDNW